MTGQPVFAEPRCLDLELQAAHPTVQLLGERRRGHTDHQRIGLVIEGGAVRGAVTAAMAAGLEQLGLTSSFDALYVVSAGAITGAYFAAGQAAQGAAGFSDDLLDRRFVNPWRLLLGGPVVNLTYAYQHLTSQVKPLMTGKIFDSPLRLHPLAADADSGQLVDLGMGRCGAELLQHVSASSCLPLLAGGPVRLGGRRLFDGGVLDSLPTRSARADGCTHLVVLKSWPGELERTPAHALETRILHRYLQWQAPALVPAALSRAERYNRDVRWLRQAARQEAAGVLLVETDRRFGLLGHLERDRIKVQHGMRAGVQALADALQVADPLRLLGATLDAISGASSLRFEQG